MNEYLSKLRVEAMAFTYGSLSFDQQTQRSDVDVLVFFERSDNLTVSRFVDFWGEQCRSAGIDDFGEVPRTKLLGATYNDLYSAIDLEPFRGRSGALSIPDILDTSEYFESDQLLRRLAFNAITMNNYFVYGDDAKFRILKEIALRNLMFLLHDVSNGHIRDAPEFVESMIYEWNGDRKEGMYLGYKDWPKLREYFSAIFSAILQHNGSGLPEYAPVPRN